MDKVVRILLIQILSVVLSASGLAQAMQVDLTDESEGGEVKVNFDYLIANGEMNKRDPGVIRQILNRRAKQGKRTVILLTSHGGYLEMTEDLAQAILQPTEQLYKQHKLSNVFVVTENCSSACAALTAILTSKRNPQSLLFYVAADSKFGFHSPVDKIKGKTTPIKDKAEREAAINKQIDFLKKAGVSETWLKTNDQMFKKSTLTEIKAKQLCEERTLIIPPDSCLPESVKDPVPYIDSIMAGSKSSLELPAPDVKRSAEAK